MVRDSSGTPGYAASPLAALTQVAANLTPQRQALLLELAEALTRTIDVTIDRGTDILTPAFVEDFTGRVLAYHAMHEEKMTKKTFEYVFCGASRAAGRAAEITGSAVNAGADVTVDGSKFSLKTEAAQGISAEAITISKLMEARWIRECRTGADFAREVSSHVGGHLEHYERMLTLRAFDLADGTVEYNLVEIPLAVLRQVKALRASDFSERTKNGGSSAKVTVNGRPAFTLRLDGSVEKITVSGLRVDVCRRHGTWRVRP
jgi:hypothetical protein